MKQKKEVKKGFWAGLFEKADNKMKEKAESSSCSCCGSKKPKNKARKCCK